LRPAYDLKVFFSVVGKAGAPRHTCLTRLREAGMALEAVQAEAGHASIESTRIYLHLADDWLPAVKSP
jgi:site-specific recombinase XerD